MGCPSDRDDRPERAASQTRLRRPGRAERRDSIRNRERIIAAAQAVFQRDGIHAPLDHIASEAGVGSGTLYRHFPDRVELWKSVLTEPLQAHLAAAQAALSAEDPWDGLVAYLTSSCELEASASGYVNLMSTHFEGGSELAVLRTEIQQAIESVVHRAVDAGAVRADLAPEDLLFVVLSTSKVIEVTGAAAPEAWRRNLAFYLDAFRPDAAHPIDVPPLTPRQIMLSLLVPSVRSRRRSRTT
ncbi:TetR/AcrR family transcriptional regulator [Nocardioides sp. KC13]|uniref:TetR/AcrR family transcriptional regulator n=1 Tax=Nocardioides turkmenicus TaxID=2711220 RepID=A0A6M1QRJ4_9ACTN|nr:TetR/AcrR family transcriptional regulator [Nocardioides sp. KC13]NGN92453.1 TetR/AcrR family transcriptional regulator [Nocardioides sp. KC13]